MFKRLKDFDKELLEYSFNSGSDSDVIAANAQSPYFVENIAPYNDENTHRFALKGDTFLPDYTSTTTGYPTIASASATWGELGDMFDNTTAFKREHVYGLADHQARFFTAFNQGERAQVPIVLIAPFKNSKLYDLPASSFTVEIKYYPEKAGGPNDGVCNLTLTGSTTLSNSFIDSDLISFHSISQDNTVLHSNYGEATMNEATASFHFRFAGDDTKVAMPANLNDFQDARRRFYGHPKPILEIFGLSGSSTTEEGAFSDKYPASLSRNDPGDGSAPAAWRRPGVLSASVGYHLSCSKWNYSYITWRTGSRGSRTGSLKFDQYGLKNGFIGGVVNYTKDETGTEHFATYSVADPGQINNNTTGSLWTNLTNSQDFRHLGKTLGLIQIGGKITPGNITYQANKFPIVAENQKDVHRNTAGGLQEGISGSNPYYGGVKEVRIWNTALDHNTLGTWSMRELDNTHPFLDNLVSYIKFDLEAGQPRVNYVGRGGNKLQGNSGAALHYPWYFPTSSFIMKEKNLVVDDSYYVMQPQSGSGYICNNDTSSYTAMRKVKYMPGLRSAMVEYSNPVSSFDNTVIRQTKTTDVPTSTTDTSKNLEWDTYQWNPFIVMSSPRLKAGSGILTGSSKFSFDMTRIIGAPVVAGDSLHQHHHAFGHEDYTPADGKTNVDRDGNNRVIRPSMFALPRDKKDSAGTSSFVVDWVDNGSGSIMPPLNYTNIKNNPCGIVSYADGIAALRDSTYAGLHNLYVYYASAMPYPTGAREITHRPALGAPSLARATWGATGSGFYNTKYSYSGSAKVRRLQVSCRANFNEFNASTNKTFAKAFKEVSSSLDHTGSVTYISGIGLYDDDGNLIATGKLSKPIRKESAQSITTKLRLDL